MADLLNGVILAGVGAPVLLWHLRHARREERMQTEETEVTVGPADDA